MSLSCPSCEGVVHGVVGVPDEDQTAAPEERYEEGVGYACADCGQAWRVDSDGERAWIDYERTLAALQKERDDARKAASSYIGPCAHGSDPFDRCDECGELGAFAAMVKRLHQVEANHADVVRRKRTGEEAKDALIAERTRERDEAVAIVHVSACPNCGGTYRLPWNGGPCSYVWHDLMEAR